MVAAAVPAAEVEAALVAGAPRQRPAGGRPAVRRLHRGAGRGGAQVAGLHAALPRPGPDADRGGDHRRPGRRRGRGAPPGRRRTAQRLTAGPGARRCHDRATGSPRRAVDAGRAGCAPGHRRRPAAAGGQGGGPPPQAAGSSAAAGGQGSSAAAGRQQQRRRRRPRQQRRRRRPRQQRRRRRPRQPRCRPMSAGRTTSGCVRSWTRRRSTAGWW